MTVPKHIEVMASATWEAKRKAGLDDNGDDIGPWFLPVAGWEDLPEHEQEAHYLRQYEIDDATAAHAALVEAGFVVMPVGLSSDQIKETNATAERGMIAAAVKP
jgi:hypothetical protein